MGAAVFTCWAALFPTRLNDQFHPLLSSYAISSRTDRKADPLHQDPPTKKKLGQYSGQSKGEAAFEAANNHGADELEYESSCVKDGGSHGE